MGSAEKLKSSDAEVFCIDLLWPDDGLAIAAAVGTPHDRLFVGCAPDDGLVVAGAPHHRLLVASRPRRARAIGTGAMRAPHHIWRVNGPEHEKADRVRATRAPWRRGAGAGVLHVAPHDGTAVGRRGAPGDRR